MIFPVSIPSAPIIPSFLESTQELRNAIEDSKWHGSIEDAHAALSRLEAWFNIPTTEAIEPIHEGFFEHEAACAA